MFVNGLTAREKYSLPKRNNLTQAIQTHLSLKQSTFFELFFHFGNLHEILNIFQKKKTLIAHVFLKLRTPKNVLKEVSKKDRFRGHFGDQHGEENKHCSNIDDTTFSIVVDHCEGNWVGKNVSY